MESWFVASAICHPEPTAVFGRPCAMSNLSALRSAIVVTLITAVIAGCAGGASGTSPSPTSGTSPSPTSGPSPGPTSGTSPNPTSVPPRVITPADALARVIATEPRLAGIQAFDTGLIGQSSWYTVEPASGVGAYVVSVRVGWGDCPAGCIDEHSWVYAVSDVAVSVVSEAGPPVPAEAWPSPPGAGRTGIAGIALAGPVCPVETEPPDPACAPRPVAGAIVLIRVGGGPEVARAVTGADGIFFVELPAGEYVVEPQPVEGLLGTAGPQGVSVVAGSAVAIQLDYDTGIR